MTRDGERLGAPMPAAPTPSEAHKLANQHKLRRAWLTSTTPLSQIGEIEVARYFQMEPGKSYTLTVEVRLFRFVKEDNAIVPVVLPEVSLTIPP